jgi:hypothetical protein
MISKGDSRTCQLGTCTIPSHLSLSWLAPLWTATTCTLLYLSSSSLFSSKKELESSLLLLHITWPSHGVLCPKPCTTPGPTPTPPEPLPGPLSPPQDGPSRRPSRDRWPEHQTTNEHARAKTSAPLDPSLLPARAPLLLTPSPQRHPLPPPKRQQTRGHWSSPPARPSIGRSHGAHARCPASAYKKASPPTHSLTPLLYLPRTPPRGC